MKQYVQITFRGRTKWFAGFENDKVIRGTVEERTPATDEDIIKIKQILDNQLKHYFLNITKMA